MSSNSKLRTSDYGDVTDKVTTAAAKFRKWEKVL